MRNTRTLTLFFAFLLFPLLACGQATQTVQFKSNLINAELPYEVALPPDYNSARSITKRYPVLYLLHGLGGNPRQWINLGAREQAARYGMIIVMAEGRDSFYTDSASASAEKFESYFVRELVPDVDRRFRTLAAREGRAVGGLSMGGYGALKFGLKHPERFALAASLSGAFDAASWDHNDPTLLAFVKPSIGRAYGALDSPTRAANDLSKLINALSPERINALPFIYLDCGTEDFLINSNRTMSALLLKRKIPHEFRQLPGRHNWPYWDAQVQEVLKLAARRLRAAQ